MAQRFFDNQFGYIYQLLEELEDEIQAAHDNGDQNYNAILDEAKDMTDFIIRHIGQQHQHPLPIPHWLPKFDQLYQTLVSLREQVNQAQQQQDPQYQAMREELMDREDGLEVTLNENFYRDFLNQLGGRRRKARKTHRKTHRKVAKKSRKAKRKSHKANRKTRRR